MFKQLHQKVWLAEWQDMVMKRNKLLKECKLDEEQENDYMNMQRVIEMLLRVWGEQPIDNRQELKSVFKEFIDGVSLEEDDNDVDEEEPTLPTLLNQFLKEEGYKSGISDPRIDNLLLKEKSIKLSIQEWQEKKQGIIFQLNSSKWKENDQLNYVLIEDAYRSFGIENPQLLKERLKIQFPYKSVSDIQKLKYLLRIKENIERDLVNLQKKVVQLQKDWTETINKVKEDKYQKEQELLKKKMEQEQLIQTKLVKMKRIIGWKTELSLREQKEAEERDKRKQRQLILEQERKQKIMFQRMQKKSEIYEWKSIISFEQRALELAAMREEEENRRILKAQVEAALPHIQKRNSGLIEKQKKMKLEKPATEYRLPPIEPLVKATSDWNRILAPKLHPEDEVVDKFHQPALTLKEDMRAKLLRMFHEENISLNSNRFARDLIHSLTEESRKNQPIHLQTSLKL